MANGRRGRGQGTKRERSPGVWQLRVRDGATTHTRTVRGNEVEADLALAQLRLDVANGVVGGQPDSLTVIELVDRWFAGHRTTLSPTTVDGYAGVIERYLRPSKLATMKVAALRVVHLDGFYAHLATAGGRHGKGLAPATVRQMHAVLRKALTQAVRWEMIQANPASHATLPRNEHREVQAPSWPELQAALRVTETNESLAVLAPFVRLAIVTGARRGELAGLRWGDLEGSTLTVCRAVVWSRAEKRLVVKETKAGKVKRLALDDETVAVLAEHRGACEALAARAGVPLAVDAYLFSASVDGSKPWHPDTLDHAWHRVRKAAGLDGVKLHDLRHAMVTHMLAAGVDPKTAADRAGHDPVTMLRIYAHAVPEKDREVADLIGRMLDRDEAEAI